MLVVFFTTGHSVLFTPWTLRILVFMSILLIIGAFIAQPSAHEMSNVKVVEQTTKNEVKNNVIGYQTVEDAAIAAENATENKVDAVEELKNEIKNFSADKIDPIYYGGRVEDAAKIENIKEEFKEAVKEVVNEELKKENEELKKEQNAAIAVVPAEQPVEVNAEQKAVEHNEKAMEMEENAVEKQAVEVLAENIKQEQKNIEKIAELANVATKQVELQTNLTEKVNTIEATVKHQNEVMSQSIKDLQNEVQVIGGAVQGLIERMTQMFSFLTTVLQGNTPNNSEKPAGAM